MNKLKDIIDILGMEPLVEEGGLWAKTICSEDILPGGAIDAYTKERPLYGAIYYLLTPDTFPECTGSLPMRSGSITQVLQ